MDVDYRSPCSSTQWPRGATAKQPIALGDLALVIVGRGITQNSMPTKAASRLLRRLQARATPSTTCRLRSPGRWALILPLCPRRPAKRSELLRGAVVQLPCQHDAAFARALFVHIDVADEHARVVLAEVDGDVEAILVKCARDVELIVLVACL